MNDIALSGHAHLRCAQRNLSPQQVAYILKHGIEIQRTGVTFITLRRCDLPRSHCKLNKYAKLEGAVILLSRDKGLITVYRNRRAFRDIHKKDKYCSYRRYRAGP